MQTKLTYGKSVWLKYDLLHCLWPKQNINNTHMSKITSLFPCVITFSKKKISINIISLFIILTKKSLFQVHIHKKYVSSFPGDTTVQTTYFWNKAKHTRNVPGMLMHILPGEILFPYWQKKSIFKIRIYIKWHNFFNTFNTKKKNLNTIPAVSDSVFSSIIDRLFTPTPT